MWKFVINFSLSARRDFEKSFFLRYVNLKLEAQVKTDSSINIEDI